ncbi:MAG: N-acetylglucosamine-6-phosphate deacetylase [Kiritimatiellae bacterium]|nr:N-acetylglucosamine-6-phosphate deacetylase [Kiritimatiellia bacterium]
MTRNGFIDLQLNGFKGINFSAPDLTLDQVRMATRELVKAGTVAYCPTVVTNSLDNFKHSLPILASAMRDKELKPHLLGIHMEGPFISPIEGARGAHPPEHIIKPDVDTFKRFQEWAEGNVVLLTLAPETEGAIPLIKYASKTGIKVSMGHHFANDDIMERAVKAGATASTHLGNGMPNMINRHQNSIWWQLSCDDIYGMFITDGHHLPPDFIKVALRSKTTEKFIVVSDSVDIAGLPAGQYKFLGKKTVLSPNGRISFGNTPYLAGSSANMVQCMNYLASLNLLTEKELWQVGFDNPLKYLGKKATDLSRFSAQADPLKAERRDLSKAKGSQVKFKNNPN